MTKICTRTAEIYLDEETILRVIILEGVTITLQDTKANFIAIEKIIQNKRVRVLIDASVNFSVSRETRDYSVKKGNATIWIATALVTNLLAIKLIGNFYIKTQKPNVPTRIFKTEAEALKWLRTFKKE